MPTLFRTKRILCRILHTSIAVLAGASSANAAALTWTGLGLDDNISTAGNWSPAQAPVGGDFLTFAGTTRPTPQATADLSVAQIIFKNTAGSFTLGGSGVYTVTTDGIKPDGITNNSASTETINNALILGAAQEWDAASGMLVFNGAVNNGGFVLTINGAKNTTLNGAISGSGGLIKTGNGALTLNGTNSYTGQTTLSGGMIVIGSDTAFGIGTVDLDGATIQSSGGSHTLANSILVTNNVTFSPANDLTFNGGISMTANRTFTFSGAGIVTFNGIVSEATGSRKLTKKGTGTLVLNGANTFKGGLTFSAGTLVLGNNAAAGTGTLSLGTGTLQAGGGARTIGNAVSLAGNTVFSGANDLTFTSTATLTGNRTLTVNNIAVTFSGAFANSNSSLTKDGMGTLTLSGTGANANTGGTIVTDGRLVLAKTAGVNAFGGTSLTIGNGTGALNSAVVQLNAADQIPNAVNITLGNDGQLNLQSFTDTITALTTTGGSIVGTGRLDLGGNITTSATGTNVTVISANVGLNANRTFTVNNNSLTTDIDLAISGVISNGSGARIITKTGLGTLLLSGANTYSGGTNVNNGLVLLDASSVGAITSGPLGTAAVNLGDTVGGNSASILFSTTGGHTVANAITVRSGSTGTLTLGGLNTSGANTYSGNVTLNRSVIVTAATGGEVDFNGAISGATFGITKTGGGTVKLGAANTFTGLTTISAGTLAYGVSNALSSGAVTINGGTLDLGANHTDTVGTVILDGGGSILGSGTSTLTSTATFDVRNGLVSAIFGGSVGLTKTTANTVTLSGVNTYSGATTISAGTLRLGATNAISSASALTVAGGTTFDLNGFSDVIGSLAGAGSVTLGSGILTAGGNNSSTAYSGVLSGAGGFTKAGTGTLTVSGVNTYAGATTIAAGTFRLGAANVIANESAVNLSAAGAIVDLNNFSETIGSLAGAGSVTLGTGTLTTGGNDTTTTFSGVISGPGALVKFGTGTMTLTGANTLSGTVTLNGGTVALSGATGTAASVSGFTLNTGTTLALDNSGGENTNRIGNSAPINLSGGTLRFISDANGSTETVGALNPSGGASSIVVVHNGLATDNTSLTFSSLGTIAPGASVNFSATGGTLGAATGPHIFITGQANGFIGGWATVGSDFAEYFTDGLRAFSNYYSGSDGVNVNDATKIVLLDASSPATAFTLTNAGTTTDLGLNVTDLATVDLGSAATRTLNLASGGLIKSAATATAISGSGRLTAGGTNSGTLAVSVNSGNTLTISSNVINNAGANGLYGDGDDGIVSLSKADAGLLVLSGANTYSGTNFLNGGVVQISTENNLGALANDVTFGGGTLSVVTGFTGSTTKLFTISANLSGTIDVAAGQTFTLGNTSNVLTTGNTASTLFKAGAGILTIQSANAGFDGTLQIDAGAVELQQAQALGDATNRGRITLNGGTLNLRGDTNTNFANNITVIGDSVIDVNRLSGTSPAVTHTFGSLLIGANTLTVSGGNGASLTIGAVTLEGNATFSTTTAGASIGAVSGNFGFFKVGAGTLVLNAAGTYTGGTGVNGGTLQLAVADSVSAASAVSVGSGATFDLNGFSDTIGSLAGMGSVQLGSGTLTTGANDTSTTFSGAISGSGSLVKTGAGTFTLGAVNAYTGTTLVSAGTLSFGVVNALDAGSEVTVAAGATLDVNNLSEIIGSIAGSGDVSLGSGTLSSGANNSSTTFSGGITGSGAFAKVGTGTLSLTGTSSLTGSINANGGILLLQNSAALGTAAGATIVGSGGELQLADTLAVAAEPLTLNGSGTAGAGALRLVSGSASWSGPITVASASTIGVDSGVLVLDGAINLGSALTFTGGGTEQIDGVISGSGDLLKNGAGTLYLTAANTFSGTATINAGTLIPQNTAAFGVAGAASGTVVMAGGAIHLNDATGLNIGAETLTLNGSGVAGAGALESIAGDNSWSGDIVLAANSTVGVDANTLTLSGAISESGGARALTKSGAGTLILDADNTYTGATQITAGILQLADADRIGDNSAVVVSPGATLDLNDFNETIGSLAGAGTVNLGATGGNTLTIGADGSSTTFSGTITGAGDLAKAGTGTLTLVGTNDYTGNTLINAGVLAIDSDARLGNGGSLAFGGGTLQATTGFTTSRTVTINTGGGTIDTNGNNVVLSGSISGSVDGITKAGAGKLIISGFANSGYTALTTVRAGTLEISGSISDSDVTVENGGTLAGGGSTGDVLALNGGNVAPGSSGAGLLSTANFDLNSGAHLTIELGGTTAGTQYDRVQVTGGLTLAGDLQGSLINGYSPAPDTLFFIVANDGTDAVIGAFNGLPQDATLSFGGRTFQVSYTADAATLSFTGGNDVALVVLPEPNAWTMLLGGFGLLLAMQRRKRY